MRVNIYEEEISQDIEIVEKVVDGETFTGIRFYLYLPVTKPQTDPATGEHRGYVQHQGKFMHHPDDDDSSAVTFWGKDDLRETLQQALDVLNKYYS